MLIRPLVSTAKAKDYQFVSRPGQGRACPRPGQGQDQVLARARQITTTNGILPHSTVLYFDAMFESISAHKSQQQEKGTGIRNYYHSHLKWIWLITNFAAIKEIKTNNSLLFIISFLLFRLQGPNQGPTSPQSQGLNI